MKGYLFNAGMLAQMPLFLVLTLIVYGMVLIHTGSYWITTCGMFQIIMAFAWGFSM